MTMPDAAAPGLAADPLGAGESAPVWHSLTIEETCRRLSIDPAVGLSDAEVLTRRERYGPNKLAEEAKEPAWKSFLRQYRDLMQLVLLGAAVVSMVALQDMTTGLVVIGLTVINAVMGLHQEGKAAESVAALREMLIMTANVRRNGQRVQVPAEELVPGDIVMFEAGDKVPADGRIMVSATLEIEEAGLTGESAPVPKSVAPVEGADVALGDRVDMGYMNSQVTRGRGEMVVTATGMGTEVGHISGMLSGVEQEKTPLTKQLDQLTVIITIMAAAALVAIVVIGLIRGESFDDLFLIGISLAIAAIPTGLPAVVTMLLSFGTQALAAKGAIVKRLRSVETLGSTSAICSDKTGTLTLNQMTARQLVLAGRRYSIDGEGYSTTGRILRVGGTGEAVGDQSLEAFMLPMALANDAVIRDGACIGDPTEGALVVLAAKSGLDIEETRRSQPRLGEVPFDAAYKLMATFHEIEGVVRCFVKGAPDVLLARSSQYLDLDGETKTIGDLSGRVVEENDRLASEGMRVLAVARRDFDKATFDPSADLLALVDDLELLALIGIVDPPRKEAKDAIALCHDAGIRVRMITGDHATTAAAIAHELGIEGRALTGAEFAAMPDDELSARARGDRRGRACRSRGQGAPGQPAQGPGEHRRDDGRRRERRPRAHARGHRRRDGDHRHRGDQGRRRDDPHRRQLRDDRRRGRRRPRPLRQPDEVHPRPDGDAGRVHPHLPRRVDLQHRKRLTAAAAADPLDQLRGGCLARARPRVRRSHARPDEAPAAVAR